MAFNAASGILPSFVPSDMRANPWSKVAAKETLLAKETPTDRMSPQKYHMGQMLRDPQFDRFKNNPRQLLPTLV